METAIEFSPVNIEERKNLDIRPGDTVRIWQKVKEGDKTRLQPFEGLVIAMRHGREVGATFTVRKVSGGVGIERIFPLYSPNIGKIELIRRSKVRRAKLFYIRKKAARAIRKKMKHMKQIEKTLMDEAAAKARAEAEVKKKEEEEAKAKAKAEQAVQGVEVDKQENQEENKEQKELIQENAIEEKQEEKKEEEREADKQEQLGK